MLKKYAFFKSVLLLCAISALEKPRAAETIIYDTRTESFIQGISVENLGGKAENLRFLSSVKDITVPHWCYLPTNLFQEVLKNEQLDVKNVILEYIELFRKGSGKIEEGEKAKILIELYSKASIIRNNILNMSLPPSFEGALLAVYNKISHNGKNAVVVRSSATTEDLPNGSFAGLYDSFLNQQNYDDVLVSIKQCWASVFNERAIQYYFYKNINFDEVAMGVIIQEMVPASISGTAFSVDITTGYPGIHIMLQHGLEGIVGGDISGDSFLIDASTLAILKKVKGKKGFAYKPRRDSSGLELTEVLNTGYCVNDQIVKRIAQQLLLVKEAYNSITTQPIDTEIAIDDEGNIKFLQVRPVTSLMQNKVLDINPVKPLQPLAYGKHAVRGAIQGNIKIIEDFKDLETGKIKIEKEDIVVSFKTENQWTQYLTQFSGIITEEGNPTAHPMLICREHSLPCLVGVPNVVEILKPYDGRSVTLDGFRKTVYLGRIPLKEVSLREIEEQFNSVKPEITRTDTEIIPELERRKLLIRSEGDQRLYVLNPGTELSGALLDLTLKAYTLRNKVLNDTGVEPTISLNTKQKVMGDHKKGQIYDEWWSDQRSQFNLCKDMTLGQAEAFYENQEHMLRSYMEVCQNFQLTTSCWQSFQEVFTELFAYKLLGILWPAHVQISTYSMASNLKTPQIFFDEYATHIQHQMQQEDNLLIEEAKRLRLKIDTILGMYTEISLKIIREQHPYLYDGIEKFSRNYKITKSENWVEEPPIELAFKRIISQSIEQETSNLLILKNINDTEFFTDYPELQRWIRLSVIQKIQRNNFHHIRLRGQWHVRDKLMELGKWLFSRGYITSDKEVLTIPCSEICSYIQIYERSQ
ncbi:PEP/pyruvate-binding domain-containing protein [Candidatus Odyssella thessalonicensis]|uniref:PEP/pyruvate-binding domain-containing protein n=1 Tax=Candidatus Odyssella thessalonicensis TaxID=84647 RepID=UPI000225A9FE|nr:PEP/pyruvate-binding domain-containing protein [Candidatus Odyssella thessalonicensis]